MAQSVRERTSELAVLKTLGFSDGRSSRWCSPSRCSSPCSAAALGLGLAWLFVQRGDPTGGMLPIFMLPARDVAVGVGLMVAAGRAGRR